MNQLIFWKCRGGNLSHKWGFGYWTGRDNDLLCVFPNLNNKNAELMLSPICNNKFFAFLGFILKRIIK